LVDNVPRGTIGLIIFLFKFVPRGTLIARYERF